METRMGRMTSLILPVWNHLYDLTIPFINQMLKVPGDWELIVVDNGSTDGTDRYLKHLANEEKRIIPVISKKNLGFGGGNNLGYKKAKGDTICFISNDVVHNSQNWLGMLEQALDKNPKSLIGPQLIDFNQLTAFDRIPTPYMAGWCVFGSREMFDEIKVRDQVWCEDFGTAYFEDVWMSVVAEDKGYKLLEVPVALHHLQSRSSDQIDIPKTTIFAKAVFDNKMMVRHLKKNKQKRIVFFSSGVPYGFLDEDFEGKGVGGAEASLILLAREFNKDGWRVEIYNRTDKVGKYNGVYYHNISEYNSTTYCDVFVLFRSWNPVVEYANTKLKLFWSCDQYTDAQGVWDMKVFPYVDKTIAISPFHKEYLEKVYSTKNGVTVIDLGINLKDYKPRKKIKGKAIFCSVPMRGLELLSVLVPDIKERVPDFNLTITSDYRLWGQKEARNGEFKGMFYKLDYVNFLGKIPREDLVKHQLEAEVMTYPCNYDECFCISAMECMAAGAVPVTSDTGALPTTIGDAGVILSNSEMKEKFVDSVVDILTNHKKRKELVSKGRAIAKQHSWDIILKDWLELIIKETKMARRKTSKKVVKIESIRKAPQVTMPSFVMLRFTKPVEFAISARKFQTVIVETSSGVVNQVEVPYDMAAQAIENCIAFYGPEITG